MIPPEHPAQLLAEVPLPGARRLISHPLGDVRSPRGWLRGASFDGELVVYDLGRLLAGDARPAARLPASWEEDRWNRTDGAFSADLTTAVYPEPTGVRAVDQAGATRWWWPHPDTGWAPGVVSGSVAVVEDRVWAVAPGVDRDGRTVQQWVVLDLATGRPLASAPLLDRSEHYARQWVLPDGTVGVELAEFESVELRWGRLDGDAVRVVTAEIDGEDIVIDHDPAGRRLFVVNHSGFNCGIRRIPDGAWIGAVYDSEIRRLCGLPADDDPDIHDDIDHWVAYHRGGFLDAARVVASTAVPTTDDVTHWILDVPGTDDPVGDGLLRCRIRYPSSPGSYLLGLHDGTWLTADEDALRRWR